MPRAMVRVIGFIVVVVVVVVFISIINNNYGTDLQSFFRLSFSIKRFCTLHQ